AVSPCDWQFSGGDGQRPEVIQDAAAEPRLRFSLSHTRGLAACLIARHVDVGVDVEPVDNKVNAMSIGERYFSAYESRQLAELSGDARHERFLEYWTLKEAYVKACGVGLSVPLDDFFFYRDGDETWQIEFSSQAHSPPNAWQFWCGRPTPDHILSIAIRRPGQRPFDVTIRETVPLGGSPDSPTRPTEIFPT
ncbi:MAG: 4'-phosphopantetheinyl transferase superfamily protein, partial [Planctomycetota bacterium]